jgi:N,N-dimethylformamidase
MEWQHAPHEYAAIHFHSDDLHDCGWVTSIAYAIEDSFPSGVYALRLRRSNDRVSDSIREEEYLPFFVAAPRGRPQAPMALILPTHTYMAYGNIRNIEVSRQKSGMSEQECYEPPMLGPGMKEYAFLIEQHPELGRSLYDHHSDGSPVHFASWLRPLLNVRPKSLLWTLCADLLLVDWLHTKAVAYDVITDDLLQEEGVELLQSYRAVMRGNHPEYATAQQLDAIEPYIHQGGRFMYMGGNGYYWRSAVHQALPGVIEVRRGRTGTGTWQSPIGESGLALSGEVGGLWRDLGRPPQQTFGVGFIAEGRGASYYRITPEARRSRAAFIVDGVDGDLIGRPGNRSGQRQERYACRYHRGGAIGESRHGDAVCDRGNDERVSRHPPLSPLHLRRSHISRESQRRCRFFGRLHGLVRQSESQRLHQQYLANHRQCRSAILRVAR